MSNFRSPTKHPIHGTIIEAEWLDDFFGRHRYGVRFKGSQTIYDAEKYGLEPEVNVGGGGL